MDFWSSKIKRAQPTKLQEVIFQQQAKIITPYSTHKQIKYQHVGQSLPNAEPEEGRDTQGRLRHAT